VNGSDSIEGEEMIAESIFDFENQACCIYRRRCLTRVRRSGGAAAAEQVIDL